MKFSKLYLIAAILLTLSSCTVVNKGGATNNQVKHQKDNWNFDDIMVPDTNVFNSEPDVAVGEYKIAILLPLTGRAANVGKSIFDAAQMSLFENGAQNFQLMPFDTADNPEKAEEAARQAVAAGANVILGPLFAEAVDRVAPVAAESNLKVFAYSNNRSVAGGNVYILGLMPDQQVKRVVDFASASGVGGYSGVVPRNIFGDQVREALERQVARNKKRIRTVEGYTMGTKDFSEISKEIQEIFKEQGAFQNKSSEALLLPEAGTNLSQILYDMNMAGFNNNSVRLLGTALWDNATTIGDRRLNGAWYASVPYESTDSFIARFQQSFGYKPDDLAALGYDSVSLAVAIAPNGFRDEEILNPSGFRGLKGAYKFDSQGINHRGYAIYEIRNGTAVVIDPAPVNIK